MAERNPVLNVSQQDRCRNCSAVFSDYGLAGAPARACMLARLEKKLERIPRERDLKRYEDPKSLSKINVSLIPNDCLNGYVSPDNRPLVA